MISLCIFVKIQGIMHIKNIGLILLISLLFSFCLKGQSILKSDSLALIALYESTSGPTWRNSWDTNLPVSLWNGVIINNDRVIEISITANELQGVLPDNLGDLSELEVLNLSSNRMYGSLPYSLFRLKKLTVLQLSGNSFSGNIPAEISNLTNLKVLSLSGNQLNGNIPPQIGNLSNLEILTLDNNQLFGFIPPELGNLQRIRILTASNNQLEGTVPDSFLKLRGNLKGFSLENNLIEPSVLEKWYRIFIRP